MLILDWGLLGLTLAVVAFLLLLNKLSRPPLPRRFWLTAGLLVGTMAVLSIVNLLPHYVYGFTVPEAVRRVLYVVTAVVLGGVFVRTFYPFDGEQ